MKYVEIPLDRVAAGRPVPVNILDAKGNLLLRKGQSIASEPHKELLSRHGASVSESDYQAWTRSYDRLINRMMRDGASVEAMRAAPMPSEILDSDYVTGFEIVGGWLDIHEVHKGLLGQAANARHPVERMEAVHRRAITLLDADPDKALFELMQALPDLSVSYAAKHALLAAVLCELTARRLAVPDLLRPALFQAALMMNVAMARLQDELVRQTEELSAAQRDSIAAHAERGAEMLAGFGLDDEDVLDIVRGHHDIEQALRQPRNRLLRLILHVVDQFIARMSTRATRAAASASSVTKSMVDMASPEAAQVAFALGAAVGFYPPGTHVALVNGETAVVARRGHAAHAPLVVSLLKPDGLPLTQYKARDTANKECAVRNAISAERIRVKVNGRQIELALARLQAGY